MRGYQPNINNKVHEFLLERGSDGARFDEIGQNVHGMIYPIASTSTAINTLLRHNKIYEHGHIYYAHVSKLAKGQEQS